MNDNLNPVSCGCGGASNIVKRFSRDYHVPVWYVECIKCNIETDDYFSESEAVEAWNRSMGERTAKVITIEKPIEESDSTISLAVCSECCNANVSVFDNYCSNCGTKLEWK